MKVELAVYYDPCFPSCWINRGHSKKIADFFSRNGVQLLNATQLRDFMSAALTNDSAHKKLVVFSQDVAPSTIVENYYSTTTLREYLDAGGSILWIGDIPLYYIGEPNKEAPTLVDVYGTPANMLGIVPVYAFHPKTTVTIKSLGRRIGLRSKWSGTRPILQDKGINVLAKSESIACRYYIEVERRKNLLARFWDWIRTIRSFKAATFEIGRDTQQQAKKKKEITKPEIHVHEAHVNAWMKCFNDYYPNSGFYRIWDYEPRNLTDSKVKELFNVAQSISRRIARTSPTFWLSKKNEGN